MVLCLVMLMRSKRVRGGGKGCSVDMVRLKVPYKLHTAQLFTLHNTHFTLHTSHYTLHTSSYTLHLDSGLRQADSELALSVEDDVVSTLSSSASSLLLSSLELSNTAIYERQSGALLGTAPHFC